MMHIWKEVKIMKCLEISNGKGYFLNSNNEMQEIDKITKEDILRLLNIATDINNTFEMDEFDENKGPSNEAHKIIYGSLYKKFIELLENKTRFYDESKAIYKDALEKYKINSDSEQAT